MGKEQESVPRVSEREQPTMLDTLVLKAKELHGNTKSQGKKGEKFAYDSFAAASDAVSTVNFPGVALLTVILPDLTINPRDIDIETPLLSETWDEVGTKIVSGAVQAELLSRYPEVKTEDTRRYDYWDARS